MHEPAKDGFRLLRINGRATNSAMVITIESYSRGSGLTAAENLRVSR